MMALLTRLMGKLSRISIATRLILLFATVVISLTAVSAYVAVKSDREVSVLERLNDRLSVRRHLIDLETGIGAYSALLEARQSVVLSQDFSGITALKQQIVETRSGVEATLQALSDRGDIDALRTGVEELRVIHDDYLRHTIEASVVPASIARRSFVAKQAALREQLEHFGPEGAMALGSLIDEFDGASRDIEALVDLVIPVAIVAASVAFLLLLVSVWRPLRRLIETIEQLDEPDSSFKIREDGPTEFSAIGRALTALRERLRAQRAAEARARENATKLQQFTDATFDVLWEIGPDLRFNWVHARKEILQPLRERVLGRTRWEAVNADPDTDPVWRRFRADLLARRPIRNFEYTGGADAWNPERWWRVSGEPFFNEDGRFGGYRGVSTDITEQKKYEQQLKRAQNMEMLGRLTSGVAHDFNNLLTVLSSNLEMLKRHGVPQDAAREMLARCQRATQRGRKLSGQLLSLGHQPEMRPERVDLCAFLQDFDELVQRTLPDEIRVTTEYEDDLPEVVVDAGLLQDALLNLVINAKDAMPDGGELRTSASRTESTVAIAVRDTGVGIDQSLRDRLFEPFFTTKSAGKGTGLGLSMVNDFAVRSGGVVEIDSAVGVGTTVTLFLPLGGAALLGAAGGERWAKDLQATVALVEEDEDLRATMRTILEVLGHQIQSFATMEEALTACRDHGATFDLLICRPLRHRTLRAESLLTTLRTRGQTTALIILVDATLEAEAAPLVASVNATVVRMPIATDILSESIQIALRAEREKTSDGEGADPR